MPIRFTRPVLVAAVGCLLVAESTQSQTASGVFMGRSGKPVAKAKLMLGQVSGDQETPYAKIQLGAKPHTAVTDDSGRFQLTGFKPGRYTIVYVPAGSTLAAPPPEINIRGLAGGIKSFLPMMRDVEVGRAGAPYPDRPWAREFTLLKGHTLWCIGLGEPLMKIWNATVRRGQQGPYMEMRRGFLWQERFDDKAQIKFEGWSF